MADSPMVVTAQDAIAPDLGIMRGESIRRQLLVLDQGGRHDVARLAPGDVRYAGIDVPDLNDLA